MRPRIRPWLPRHDRPYSTPRARAPVFDSVRESLAADEAKGTLSVDSEKRTVSAAGKELPLSPVMDRELLERDYKRRGPKPRVGPKRRTKRDEDPAEKFRTNLSKSLYAQMLAKPVRYCSLTRVRLPYTFLQAFRAAVGPSGDKAWWVPEGLLATDPHPFKRDGNNINDRGGKAVQHGSRGPTARAMLRADVLSPQPDTAQKRESVSMQMMSPNAWRAAKMPGGKPPVWRERMGEVVLEELRRDVRNRLLEMARLGANSGKLVPMVPGEKYDTRGYVLWTSPEAGGGVSEGRWTMDLEGVGAPGLYASMGLATQRYAAHLPVYNLRLLLGEKHLESLREEVELFRENKMVLVARSGADETQREMWKLQGMLAEFAAF